LAAMFSVPGLIVTALVVKSGATHNIVGYKSWPSDIGSVQLRRGRRIALTGEERDPRTAIDVHEICETEHQALRGAQN
jgi:hypothetical protein